MSNVVLGPARNRVDGRLKVTGAATYSAEFAVPQYATAWTVESNIASGKITTLDTTAAEAMPGVLAVLTHLNAPKLNSPLGGKERESGKGIRNEDRFPLKDAEVHYAGQYIALVVAQTLEQARHAAGLVRVTYAAEVPQLNMEAAKGDATKPKTNNGEKVQLKKGDVNPALADASLVRVEQTYSTPTEHHNPIEMSGTIAVWEAADKLTLYDATQFVKGVQSIVARAFELEEENVRVFSPFVGGAFGCKGAVWPHVLLAAMAAKVAGVPVKLHVTRRNMFTSVGHRTPTWQKLALAANADGKLQAIRHVTDTLTSTVGAFVESCGARSSGILYDTPALWVEENVYPVNLSTPTFMRAPGECPGTFALECAMDELAVALKMDPLALRVANHADKHPVKDVPFSAKFLKEAYEVGAQKFGWAQRTAEPGSMRDGDLLVGWGMATATYPAYKRSAAARVTLRADGSARVECATHDLGTGAYTAFTQVSSELLGLPFEKITFELGKSDLPFGPVAGGSNSTATVTVAIHDVAGLLHQALAEIAVKDAKSALFIAKAKDVVMTEPGRLGLKADASKTDGFVEILQRAGRESIVAEGKEKKPEMNDKLAFQSFGVHFCEVKVDPLLPRVQVTRVVSVINGGRIVNEKTATSQIMGGVVMGIGMALTEETAYDPATGAPVTRNLADYHVPTNADIPPIEVTFVGEPDFEFNPLGARGLGEIGNTGIAAAVANAVFHATGKRIRNLPITPDKLL